MNPILNVIGFLKHQGLGTLLITPLIRFAALISFAALGAASPGHGQSTTKDSGGIPVASGVKYETIGTYDLARLKAILSSELVTEGFCKKENEIAFEAPRYSVKLYRVTYPSAIPEKHNRPTIASGLIAIPETRREGNPIVCYQHGTVFSKTQVPSFPEESMETRLMIAQFASQGYIVLAADYFGKGISAEGDSYLVKSSTQQACVDMLIASRGVLAEFKIAPGPLFLSGWSQGGWATLVLLQHLESLGVTVKAAATASAPADVYTVVNRWINNPQPNDAVYLPGILALQLGAQEQYLQGGLVDMAIKTEYAKACRDLYANRIDWQTFRKQTPGKPGEMLKSEFLAASALGETEYWVRLQAAHGYRWRSRTPMRCYYGESDEVVPVYIARLPEGFHAITGGGPTEAISAGAQANHRDTFLFAVKAQKRWFDELLKSPADKTK